MRLPHHALLCALLLAACTDDPANTPAADMSADMAQTRPDMAVEDLPPSVDMPTTPGDMAGGDMSPATDMPATPDDMASGDMPDEDMVVAPDMMADMAGEDMIVAPDMAVEPDMAPDMNMPQDPYAGRPLGQCDASADCGAGGSCTRTAPGGICAGAPDVCDALTGSYSANFGACQRDCSSDAECPPGMSCGSQSVCIIQRCVNSVCPVPLFGCTAPTSTCTRVDCSQGQTCPADTTCTRGLCVEDRELP